MDVTVVWVYVDGCLWVCVCVCDRRWVGGTGSGWVGICGWGCLWGGVCGCCECYVLVMGASIHRFIYVFLVASGTYMIHVCNTSYFAGATFQPDERVDPNTASLCTLHNPQPREEGKSSPNQPDLYLSLP